MPNRRIYRYRLDITDHQAVEMPFDAHVLSVGPPRDESDTLDLWALVRPEWSITTREFRIIGTGNPVPDVDLGVFIGTVSTHGGALIWHVFDSTVERF